MVSPQELAKKNTNVRTTPEPRAAIARQVPLQPPGLARRRRRLARLEVTVEKPGINVQIMVELVIATPRSDTETLLQPHGRYRGMHLAEVFLVPIQYLVIRNMVS